MHSQDTSHSSSLKRFNLHHWSFRTAINECRMHMAHKVMHTVLCCQNILTQIPCQPYCILYAGNIFCICHWFHKCQTCTLASPCQAASRIIIQCFSLLVFVLLSKTPYPGQLVLPINRSENVCYSVKSLGIQWLCPFLVFLHVMDPLIP